MSNPTACPPGAADPVRVLYIDYSVGFGGGTKSLSLVFRALPDVDKFVLTCQTPHQVDMWYRDVPVWRFRRLVNYQTAERIHRWMRRHVPLRPLQVLVAKGLAVIDLATSAVHLARIAWLIRRHRIDFIHLNNGYTPLEGLLAARLTGTPCIVHLRGFLVNDKRSIGRLAMRYATHTIAVSDAVGRSAEAAGISAGDITTIYDPVDVPVYEATASRREDVRRGLGIRPDEVAIGIFGRVIAWKGHREFVQAAMEAMDRDPRIRAVIVGDQSDGSREYFDDIKRRISESPHANRFVLAGYRRDVAEVYHAMDIVTHASIEAEPFGMVVPEAMAARRAIIATAAGGPCEVIAEGEDGLLVTPGDIAAMRDAMIQLAASPDRRQAMGIRGFDKVSRGLRVDQVARRVTEVYTKLQAENGGVDGGNAGGGA